MHHTLGLNIFTELNMKYFGFYHDCYLRLACITAHEKESHFSEPLVIHCLYTTQFILLTVAVQSFGP
jgi:hypothetical protein